MAFTSILSISCIDQIELDFEGGGDRVVIFGNINTTELEQAMEIYRITAIQNRFLPISGATVFIIDDLGNRGRMFGDNEGIYRLVPNGIEIVPGRSYYLDIKLIDGAKYQTKPQRVPLVKATEDLNRRYRETASLTDDGVTLEKIIFEILGTTSIENPQEEDFYIRWQVVEDYVLRPTDFPDPLSFSETPPEHYYRKIMNEQRILTFSSEGTTINTLGTKIVAFKDFDDSFLDKHFFTTSVHSMTREAYLFWNEVNTLTNASGSIFDVPPGKIRGNIVNVEDQNEEVLGFVEFSNTTWSRFVTFIDDGPFLPPETCKFSPFKEDDEYPLYCLECLEREGCSLIRPAMFDE